jgi:hypothetical protein
MFNSHSPLSPLLYGIVVNVPEPSCMHDRLPCVSDLFSPSTVHCVYSQEVLRRGHSCIYYFWSRERVACGRTRCELGCTSAGR